MKGRILFVSTLDVASWGGSEELWSRGAQRLLESGWDVSASVRGRQDEHPRVQQLEAAGCRVTRRYPNQPRHQIERVLARVFWGNALHDEMSALGDSAPQLVAISQGTISDGLPWMLASQQLSLPYCVITHGAYEGFWPSDDYAAQKLARGLTSARRCFYVSKANLRTVESMIGQRLSQAMVIRNPCNVPYDIQVPWPGDGPLWQLACVGRLDPISKAQDLLLEVMSLPKWAEREIEVSIYGSGPCEQTLKRWAGVVGTRHVTFSGHTDDVVAIWRDHHALIQPSRFEGMPLTLVEAMLCGRLAIVTDVAGHTELVQDGVTGFVAAAPNVAQLDATMERAWQERHRWQAMGTEAARFVRAQIGPDPVGDFVAQLKKLF